jgi:hypothetical protein
MAKTLAGETSFPKPRGGAIIESRAELPGCRVSPGLADARPARRPSGRRRADMSRLFLDFRTPPLAVQHHALVEPLDEPASGALESEGQQGVNQARRGGNRQGGGKIQRFARVLDIAFVHALEVTAEEVHGHGHSGSKVPSMIFHNYCKNVAKCSR